VSTIIQSYKSYKDFTNLMILTCCIDECLIMAIHMVLHGLTIVLIRYFSRDPSF